MPAANASINLGGFAMYGTPFCLPVSAITPEVRSTWFRTDPQHAAIFRSVSRDPRSLSVNPSRPHDGRLGQERTILCLRAKSAVKFQITVLPNRFEVRGGTEGLRDAPETARC
jgi:hypothetical protein